MTARTIGLYIVHMKRFSAAKARQELAHVLDAAERGEGVVIERRGVQFEVRPLPPRRRSKRRASLVVSLDPALEAGQWTWELGPRGMRFKKTGSRT